MEVQFNELIEATLSDIHRKHRSVKMLFPTFDDRVKNVQLMGGIRLKEVDDDNWHFSVHSGTKKDVWYDCTLHFKNIQEVLEHYVKDRRLWVEDRSRVDLKKLAAIFVEKVDVQVFCSCPAFLYFGPAYILGRPKYDAKYTDPEHRPPNKRNPKQYGATCKHFTNVLKALPFYTGTIAKWLRDFYARDIAGYEKEAMREFGWLRKAATALGKKKVRVERKPVKAPEKKPEPTKTEAEEEGRTQPETEGNTPPETQENERITESKDEQYKWFINRTNKHVSLVKNAAKKIVGAYPEFEDLLKQVEVHDASKLEEPEKTPYVSITWRHKLENERGEFDPINNKGYQTPGLLAKEDENTATLHHITTNSHHPEYHLKDKQDANINSKDRDKSNSCVDATAMPDLDIAEMVADWQAMSEELGKNTSRQWFNKQKDVRWHFSAKQEQLIDGLLRVFEAVVDESTSIRLTSRLLEKYRL